MNQIMQKSISALTQDAACSRLRKLLDGLEEPERRAVLAFFSKMLDVFEEGTWKVGK